MAVIAFLRGNRCTFPALKFSGVQCGAKKQKLKQNCKQTKIQEKSAAQEHSDEGLEDSVPKLISRFVSQIAVNKIHQKDQDMS